MQALVLDLDHLEEGALELIVEALRAKGIKFWYWHTHTYPGVRVLVPFHAPFPVSTPADWSKRAWPALVKHLELDDIAKADTACKDPARLYYEPRKPTPDSPHRSGFVPGEPLNWESVVPPKAPVQERLATLKAPQAVSLGEEISPEEDTSRPVDTEALRQKLLKSKSAFAVKLAKGEALSPPPNARAQGDTSRHMSWWYALGSLSMQAEPWMASEALLELCRPSHIAEVTASPDDHTPFEGPDSVTYMLGQQRVSAVQRKAENAQKKLAAHSLWEKTFGERFPVVGGSAKEPEEEGDPASGAAGSSSSGLGLGGEDLFNALKWKPSKADEEPVLLKSLHNLNVMLRESCVWCGAFRKNQLTGMVEIWSGPLFTGKVEEFRNEHIALVRQWFVAEFNTEFAVNDVDSYVELSARDHSYDPVVDYLRSVAWDGVPRLDSMLERYFSVGHVEHYTQPVSAKWMISAVARALRPGCQVDTMLVLQGKQGIRKSTAARVLGGKWATDFDYDMGSDEARGACSENWILEVGELSSLNKTQRDQVKQFITKRFDKFRAKYARRQDNHPRRCVFIGTTNEDEIFSDETGNRRFWPVLCTGQIDTDGLLRDRDQLWAEAVHRFEAGEAWYLTAEQEAVANQQTELRMKHDSLADKILDWLAGKEPTQRPAEFRLVDASTGIGEPTPDKQLQTRLGGVLKTLGFEKSRRKVDGINTTFYKTPHALLNTPKRNRSEMPTPQGLSLARA
jgi:predicted P-loop ATPase